jgi:hypothetical protein
VQLEKCSRAYDVQLKNEAGHDVQLKNVAGHDVQLDKKSCLPFPLHSIFLCSVLKGFCRALYRRGSFLINI